MYIKYFWKGHISNLISLWRLPTVSGSLLTINFIVLEETSVVKICTGTSDERLGIPRSYALTIKVITGSTKFIAPPFNPTIEKMHCSLKSIAYQQKFKWIPWNKKYLFTWWMKFRSPSYVRVYVISVGWHIIIQTSKQSQWFNYRYLSIYFVYAKFFIIISRNDFITYLAILCIVFIPVDCLRMIRTNNYTQYH